MTSIKDIAWLAGILEGEASFGLTNNKKNPCIWIGMSDSDVIEKVKNLIDPSKSIHVHEDKRKEGYKSIFKLTFNGTRAVSWMMTIYPLMSIRRKAKIREVLHTWINHEAVTSQIRGPMARAQQGLVFRLRRNGYSESEVEIAKVLISAGFTDQQIFEKLGHLKTTDTEVM